MNELLLEYLPILIFLGIAGGLAVVILLASFLIARQRPDTASGVVFVTLEDETGNVNVVVWSRLVERQRRELLTARLLTVQGVVERAGEVVHVIANRLIDSSALLGELETTSRDFR